MVLAPFLPPPLMSGGFEEIREETEFGVTHFSPVALKEAEQLVGLPANIAELYTTARSEELSSQERLAAVRSGIIAIESLQRVDGLRGSITEALRKSLVATGTILSLHSFEHMPKVEVSLEEAVRIGAEILRSAANPNWKNMEGDTENDVFEQVAGRLKTGDQHGHHTHGLSRVIDYAAKIRSGYINPAGEAKILQLRPDFARVDAGGNFGQIGASIATEHVIHLAGENGAATVTADNMYHAGRLYDYAEEVAKQGYFCFAALNNGGRGRTSISPDGLESVYGTNPIAIAIPRKNGRPSVLDTATTKLTEGHVYVSNMNGLLLPAGILRDHAGKITTDPSQLYLPENPAVLLPWGHRGTAFAEMIELWVNAMTGRAPGVKPKEVAANGFVITAIDMNGIADLDTVTAFAEKIANVKTASGKPGRLPGDRGAKAKEDSDNAGVVSIPKETWQKILELHAQVMSA